MKAAKKPKSQPVGQLVNEHKWTDRMNKWMDDGDGRMKELLYPSIASVHWDLWEMYINKNLRHADLNEEFQDTSYSFGSSTFGLDRNHSCGPLRVTVSMKT